MYYKLSGLLYVDDTDLVAMSNGNKIAKEVAKRAQKLLDCWQQALNFTGGELKLEKCFWTIQDYKQKAGQCILIKETRFEITINKDGVRIFITYIPPQTLRTLVFIEVNHTHNTKYVIPMFQEKINQYIARINMCKLAPMIIL